MTGNKFVPRPGTGDRPGSGHPWLLDPGAAREILDALRLLEGRYRGQGRELLPATQAIREAAEVSGRIWRDHALAPTEPETEGDVVLSLLTYEDVAERLQVSLPTVKRLAGTGELPTVHIGRTARVRPQDLQHYIDAVLGHQHKESA